MGSRSRISSLGSLGDCDVSYQECANPPIYGQDGGYQPLPNYTPAGSGGSIPLSCDPSIMSCPDQIPGPRPPIGNGGSRGVMTGTMGGYTPMVDYGPDMESVGGYTGEVAKAPTGLISVVTEKASGLFSGAIFGLPKWLVIGLGALAAYKFSTGRRS